MACKAEQESMHALSAHAPASMSRLCGRTSTRPALSVAPVVSQALTKLIAQDKRADCREGGLPHRLGNNGGDTVWAPDCLRLPYMPKIPVRRVERCLRGGSSPGWPAWLSRLGDCEAIRSRI